MGTAEIAAYALRLAAVMRILGEVWFNRPGMDRLQLAVRRRRLTSP